MASITSPTKHASIQFKQRQQQQQQQLAELDAILEDLTLEGARFPHIVIALLHFTYR